MGHAEVAVMQRPSLALPVCCVRIIRILDMGAQLSRRVSAMLGTQEVQARALRVHLQHTSLLLGRGPAPIVQSTRIRMRRARLSVSARHGPLNKMVCVKAATPGTLCIRIFQIAREPGKIVTGRKITTRCNIFVGPVTPVNFLQQTVYPRPVARVIPGMVTWTGHAVHVQKGNSMMPRSCNARSVLSVRPRRDWGEQRCHSAGVWPERVDPMVGHAKCVSLVRITKSINGQ